MPRIKLSEFRAKQLIFESLGIDYGGVSIDLSVKDYPKAIKQLPSSGLYVAKVDQAVKKRGKGGLVALKRTKGQLVADLKSFAATQGYKYALVEPYIEHSQGEEHYLALQRSETGVSVSYSPKGGVDVEANPAAISRISLPEKGYDPKLNTLGLDNNLLTRLYELFQKSHMTLLEINPLLIKNDKYLPLDAAVEVDSAGQFFVSGAWTEADIREQKENSNKFEEAVKKLNAKSPASFSLKTLNPNGSIFLLLSGGGASVVVADELSRLTDFKLIANYGEYSGNPSQDETQLYTQQVLRMMMASKAPKKELIIAGGVANFTDVSKTFAGIITAMQIYAKDLKNHKIKVFVRRGGPNQTAGLKAMSNFLSEIGVEHWVYGPDKSLSAVVAQAAGALR